MDTISLKKWRYLLAKAMLGIFCFCGRVEAAEECPSSASCAPCGESVMTMPLPSYGGNGVHPFQNYLATYENCVRGGWSGFYFGTGFGYGAINYSLLVPGITFQEDYSNSYITEYVTIGFAHSRNRFFIAGELGGYYNSVTKPIFYEDPSSLVFTQVPTGPLAPSTVTVLPCGVRLDINAQNHVALDLLPGFVVSPRLTIFSRIGFEYTTYSWLRRICIPQVSVDVADQIFVFVDVNDIAAGEVGDIGDKQTDAVIDFRLGLGASYAAGPHLSFNVNFVHIFGSKASFTPNADLITGNGPILTIINTAVPVSGTLALNGTTLTAQNSIDPSRNEILLGMTLNF